ncbi:probable WRKY transcription factor 40 [Daucus carota subsp. sativus]|uniref:probable WRKY transcription factor 40 n=1 Tax=Daucus carota subsp. sativus TaxID=79200 RepID=UPI0007B26D66|nr:PREDICTED: probable WRKY transcription factor 40 [Daucus carota subsp. sativus]
MEYSSTFDVDTSLDLNAKPLQLFRDTPKQEVQTSFIDFGRRTSVKEENNGALVEELNRVNTENKKLTEMLTVMCENYNTLRNNLMDYMSKNPEPAADNNATKKRKSAERSSTTTSCMIKNNASSTKNNDNSESCSTDEDHNSTKKPKEEHVKAKISRVYFRSEASDTTGLIVKDGYQWRKYGQKVTRDNPSPRAYFKCSYAPTCPVKKKVQRSIDDQSILVATYEGEHNHPHPAKVEANDSSSNRSAALASFPCSTSLNLSAPAVTLDSRKTKSKPLNEDAIRRSSSTKTDSPEFQQFLVDQMASSLTKDPSFKAALAAAISGKILQQNQAAKE